jgi:organic hydroperoxide reductase OsmC/OhrA
VTAGHATHRYTAQLSWAQITVQGDAPDDARLIQLVDTAHRHCFIANSLTTEIAIEPRFHRVPG